MKRLFSVTATLALLLGVGQAQAAPVLISGFEMNSTIQADLAARGLTATIVSPSNLATTNFSGYSAIWLGWVTTYSFDGTTQAKLANFLSAGGNVLVETPGSNVLSFIPFGNEITQTFGGTNQVQIVDPTNPVVAGLTDASLSNWDGSAHDGYSYTGIGSFDAIVKDANSTDLVTVGRRVGLGYLTVTAQDPDYHIKFGSGATGPSSSKADFVVNALTVPSAAPTPEPATCVIFGALALGGFGYVRRRLKPVAAA